MDSKDIGRLLDALAQLSDDISGGPLEARDSLCAAIRDAGKDIQYGLINIGGGADVRQMFRWFWEECQILGPDVSGDIEKAGEKIAEATLKGLASISDAIDRTHMDR